MIKAKVAIKATLACLHNKTRRFFWRAVFGGVFLEGRGQFFEFFVGCFGGQAFFQPIRAYRILFKLL